VRCEEEVRKLKNELEEIVSFIGEYGDFKDLKDPNWIYACTVVDTLSWVLGEIDTEKFLSNAYLNMSKLRKIMNEIILKKGKR